MSTRRYIVTDDGPVAIRDFDFSRKRHMPEKFGTATFISDSRTAYAQALLAANTEPNKTAYNTMVATYDLTRVPGGPGSTDPYTIPGTVYGDDPSENIEAVNRIRFDSIAAYNFALRWKLTGSEPAAAAAVAQMDPWTEIVSFFNPGGTNTRLGWAVHFPMMLAAASMVEGSAACTPTFMAAMSALATESLEVPGSLAWANSANQGDWATYMVLAVAGYTHDEALFTAALARWRRIMDISIDSNGDLWQEIYRENGTQGNGVSGLHYCSHALVAKIYAAELARANGVWLFDYTTPRGFGLRSLWERIVPWMRFPLTYPYNSSGEFPHGIDGSDIGAYEILQEEWPTADSTALLAANRPIFDRRGGPYMTVTYPGLLLRG